MNATAIPSALPSPSPTLTPSPSPVPSVTPVLLDAENIDLWGLPLSNEVDGWPLYRDTALGFRVSVPPVASLARWGDQCLRADLPEGGFMVIVSSETADLPDECRLNLAVSEMDDPSTLIRFAGETLMAASIGDNRFQVDLSDRFTLTYGLRAGVDPESVDAQVSFAVIGDMLDSIRFEDDFALPVVTPTSIPQGCLDQEASSVEAPLGNLRILYRADGQLMAWREEDASAFNVPDQNRLAQGDDSRVSEAQKYEASVKNLGENQHEIWMTPLDGGAPFLLVSLSSQPFLDQYEGDFESEIFIEWINETQLAYFVSFPANHMGGGVFREMIAIDVESLDRQTLYSGGEAWVYRFLSDGRMLLLKEDGLRVIDSQTGLELDFVPLVVPRHASQTLELTPDQSTLPIYIDKEIALYDVTNGDLRTIPLPYQPIGLGGTTAFPSKDWITETVFQTIIFKREDAIFDDNAYFYVWQVDIEQMTAVELAEFKGFGLEAVVAPNHRFVTYWIQNMANERKLYLGDIETGESFLYDELDELEILGWDSTSQRLFYRQWSRPNLIIGDICGPPQPLSGVNIGVRTDVTLVDDQRLLILNDINWAERTRLLRLVTISGEVVNIANIDAERYPLYEFYFE
ncbi:MAG: hypothetical protein AAF633_22970 [Chloroflexota bacterium]